MESYTLKEGLGDCLIAAAAIEEKAKRLNTKIGYNTHPLLHQFFDTHPYITLTDNGTKLLWPSQTKNPLEYFKLHTVNRFANQLGIHVYPSTVVTLYRQGLPLKYDKPAGNIICINVYSAESNRRYIDQNTIQAIENVCNVKNYNIKYIGSCNKKSQIIDISEMIAALMGCKLFIGPVSFCYHLASAIGVPCLLLGNYMPSYKFSNFTNTHSIDSDLECIHKCESNESELRDKMNCWERCKANPDIHRVISILETIL